MGRWEDIGTSDGMIRAYQESDFEAIRRMHLDSGLNYDLPNLQDPRVILKQVVEDEEGIHVAAFLRQTHEAYLFCDKHWRNPQWRLETIKTLQESVRAEARHKGVKEVWLWCPSAIEKQFGSRLVEMGWEKLPWPTYSQNV